MSPARKGSWHAEALEWGLAGVTGQVAAERWGVSYTCAYERMRSELARVGQRRPRRRARREPDYSHTDAYAQGFEKGRGSIGRSLMLLEEITNRLAALEQATGQGERTATKLEARLSRLEQSIARALTQVTTRLDNLTLTPPAAEPASVAVSKQPPSTLWPWIVTEVMRELGESGTAEAVGISVAALRMIERGTVTPKAKERDELRRLVASIWGREFFVDQDDLEDERDRVVKLSTASRLGLAKRSA